MSKKYNINEKVKTIHNEIGIIKDISFNENIGKTVYLIYFGNSTYKWYAKDEINKMKKED